MSTVNVNLNRQCNKVHQDAADAEECPSRPILIPCPVKRSVTFTVRLGECDCALSLTPQAAPEWHHASRCPAKPISVACSIGGGTWEKSHPIADWDMATERIVGAHRETVWPAIVALWEIVKNLVTGQSPFFTTPEDPLAVLAVQRDAVFAEVAALALAEKEAFERQEKAVKSLGEPAFLPDNFHRAESQSRPSASILERYVERMIEQVGAL